MIANSSSLYCVIVAQGCLFINHGKNTFGRSVEITSKNCSILNCSQTWKNWFNHCTSPVCCNVTKPCVGCGCCCRTVKRMVLMMMELEMMRKMMPVHIKSCLPNTHQTCMHQQYMFTILYTNSNWRNISYRDHIYEHTAVQGGTE